MAQSPAKAKFTVAVWHPPGQPAPDRLLAALHAKGITTLDVASPYAALAEACALRNTPQESDGRRPGRGVVLVFPERLESAQSLLAAVWRYAPGTRCWGYGPASNPRLTPIVEPEASEPESPSPAAEPPTRQSTKDSAIPLTTVEPKLKLTASDGVIAPSAMSDLDDEESDADSQPRRPLLSAEELSMLLGDDDEEHA